jgi:hypothetical protein
VVPCHLQGTLAAFPPGTRLPRPRKLVLRLGPARTFANTANERDGWNEIASLLEADVRRLGGEPAPNFRSP